MGLSGIVVCKSNHSTSRHIEKVFFPRTPNSRSHGEYETAVPTHYGVERNLIFVVRIREMVSFELGIEIRKDVFTFYHERGTKKKF